MLLVHLKRTHTSSPYELPWAWRHARPSSHVGGKVQIAAPSWCPGFSSNKIQSPHQSRRTKLSCIIKHLQSYTPPPPLSGSPHSLNMSPAPPTPMLGIFLICTGSPSTPKPHGYSQTHCSKGMRPNRSKTCQSITTSSL